MQKLRFSRYFKALMISLDIIVFVFIFLYFHLKNNFSIGIQNYTETDTVSLFIIISFWILLSGKTNLYNLPRTLTYTNYLSRLISHISLFILGVFLLAKIVKNPFYNDNKMVIVLALFIALFITKSFIFFVLKFIRTKGYNYRNVMFLGRNSSSDLLKERIIKRKDYGYRNFNFPIEDSNDIIKIKKFWKQNGIHTLFVANEFIQEITDENPLLKEAEDNRIKVIVIPQFLNHRFFSHHINYIESFPVLSPIKFPLEHYSNFIIKRSFDFIFATLFFILIGFWLFPIIAILIKIDSKGSVFFIQKRYGYHDEVFKCFKFRTMIQNDNSDTSTTAENDSRVTKIGKFLRKNSLDELPQFFNVILGDMSIVGPRPHMLLVDDYYKPLISRYNIRSLVLPGITGLAQVNGLRGDKGEMKYEMKKRILADSYYIKNWSFVLDLVIIMKTIFLMIKGDKNAN